eukprot:6463488-Pyramimonas_sp.AAC.1
MHQGATRSVQINSEGASRVPRAKRSDQHALARDQAACEHFHLQARKRSLSQKRGGLPAPSRPAQTRRPRRTESLAQPAGRAADAAASWQDTRNTRNTSGQQPAARQSAHLHIAETYVRINTWPWQKVANTRKDKKKSGGW